MSRPWIKSVKEKPRKPIKDGYTRATQETDGYRTI